MIEVLVGVFVGYLLAFAPRIASFFVGLIKKEEPDEEEQPKARQPTEEEQRRYEQKMREYVNFMSYDGSTQE